jgi:putative nucleotidyltransferase with HDIG domain
MGTPLKQRIDHLPTLPTVLQRLFQTLDDGNSSAQDIEAALENDPSTTARLLAVANSAYYGLRHQVNTVDRAVVVLGVEEVRGICLGTVLTSMFSGRNLRDQASAEKLWRHTLAVQEAAKLLSQCCGQVKQGQAATAALLHDLGWLVIMAYQPEEWDQVLEAINAHEGALFPGEEATGQSHTRIGADLGRHWDLPPEIQEAMVFHHQPSSPAAALSAHRGDPFGRLCGQRLRHVGMGLHQATFDPTLGAQHPGHTDQ